MEISHLKIFQTVAALGSVSGAAGQLNCVQSNVTIRIKSLEEELGETLFYRKPRGMILTPAGHLLLKYANQIIHLEKEAKKAVSDDTRVRGRLMLGAFESVAAIRLPALLAKFHGLYPEVELSLITGTSTELNQNVLDYGLDGVFVTDGYQLPNLKWQEAFREDLVLVCPAGNGSPDKAARKGILVFPKPCIYRDRLETWLQHQGLCPAKKIELGSTDGMIKCVAAGMGVSALPLSNVRTALDSGVISVYPVEKDLESVPIMFVTRKDTLVSKPLRAFLELMPEVMSDG